MPNTESATYASPVECDQSNAAAALRLVFNQLHTQSREHMVAEVLSRGTGKIGGLFAIQRGARLFGAIWAEIQPGRTAVVWPPTFAEIATQQQIACLVDAAVAHLSAKNITMAQVLLADDQSSLTPALTAAGFKKLTDLAYMAADVRRDDDASDVIQFEAFRPNQSIRLARLIERTYVGSRDCPAIEGARSIDDVLEGYRGTGAHDPARWWIARYQDKDIGVLLMTDHPTAGQWEVVYMGVTPEARGQGFGSRIVAHALSAAWRSGTARVVLAVDAENLPAIDVYRSAGFNEWDRRTVLLKRFY